MSTNAFQDGGGPAILSDEQLVERVIAGDTPLFEVLMRRHNQRLFRAVRSILRDCEEVEDVIQETYLRAFAQLARFERSESWATWITRIAMKEALVRARQRGLEGGQRTLEPGPEDKVSERELVRFLERAIDALPEIYRVVYVLREVEGLPAAEVAASLEISEDLVKVRLYRARTELRRIVEGRLEDVRREVLAFHLSRCDRIVRAVLARASIDRDGVREGRW